MTDTEQRRTDEEIRDALHAVLQTSQPSRFRLLQVICDQQHRLLDVYQTALGPVFIGKNERTRATMLPAERRPDRKPTFSFGGISDIGPLPLQVECSHRQWAEIPMEWLEAQLRQGKRRVIWRNPKNNP
jgi:hypothetical protein